MDIIRTATKDDLVAIKGIAAATGHAGEDARARHPDPGIIGDIFAAPYLEYAPAQCVVVQHDGCVKGYCVGTSDTHSFETWQDHHWWPRLRQLYPMPAAGEQAFSNEDQHWRALIHAPTRTPRGLADNFPGHLHLNLLPEARGAGAGQALVAAWIKTAQQHEVPAAHVGVDPRNARAATFWTKRGFEPLSGYGTEALWMGCRL